MAGDWLIVLLMARAGLRRAEVLGLRRSDVHLLADSRVLGCEMTRAHLHVVRREDNPNGAVAKSRRQRVVPLDFVTVRAFDTYEFERMRVPRAAAATSYGEPVPGAGGAPMRLDAVNDLVTAASGRAGLRRHPRRIRCGTRSLPTSWTLAERSTRLRSCSGTPRSPPRRFTPTPTPPGSGPLSTRCPAPASWPG